MGNLILILSDTEVKEMQKLQESIAKELNLVSNSSNVLEFIHELFKTALNKTVDNNFTKTDAYYGLIQTCIRNNKLPNSNLKDCNIEEFQAKINEMNRSGNSNHQSKDFTISLPCMMKATNNNIVKCSGEVTDDGIEQI